MTAWCVALMPNAHTGFRSDRIFPIVCLSKNISEQNLNLQFKFQHMCKAGSKSEEGSASKDFTFTTNVECQYYESCLLHRTRSPAALVSLSLTWLPCPSCFVESNIVGFVIVIPFNNSTSQFVNMPGNKG